MVMIRLLDYPCTRVVTVVNAGAIKKEEPPVHLGKTPGSQPPPPPRIEQSPRKSKMLRVRGKGGGEMRAAFGGNKDILEVGELRRRQGLWVRWDIFGFGKEKVEEKLGEMRRREREEEEGEVRPRKSKMWRVRGKQRAGGTRAATLPNPLLLPSPSLLPPSPPSPHPPPSPLLAQPQ